MKKMMSDSTVAGYAADVEEAFPLVDPGARPLGARVLVQLRRTKKTVTASGIVLVEETRETEKWQNMVGKVLMLGPLAFRKRDSMEPWVEGVWVKEGDFVRVPKWGGDRWEVPMPNAEHDDDPVLFMVLNDHELIATVTGNPLAMKAFI
jgi:co-chaperonin GroES (HSP10)